MPQISSSMTLTIVLEAKEIDLLKDVCALAAEYIQHPKLPFDLDRRNQITYFAKRMIISIQEEAE